MDKKWPSSQDSLSAVVDKERLAKAVTLSSKETLIPFGKQMMPGKAALNSMKLEELGDIQVPVSLMDMKRLKRISHNALCGSGYNKYLDPLVMKALCLESSKILSTSPIDFCMSSHVAHLLNLPTELMDIEVKLDRLIFYETGGHYKPIRDSSIEPGIFGTAILQLPVEGGHEGGRFKVEYKGKKEIFENQDKSNQNYYLSAYYNCCYHSMEPVTRGFKLTLVFSLIWKNIKIATKDFPVFLTALTEVKRALTPWIQEDCHIVNKTGKDNSSHSGVKEDSLTFKDTEDDIIVESQQISPLPLDVKEKHEASAPIVNSLRESEKETRDVEPLFFVLQEKYEESDLAFHCLRGPDRDLAYFLQCCLFLEVHLAVVKHTITTENHTSKRCSNDNRDKIQEKQTTEISRWIDSNDVKISLNLQLDWEKQRVGSIRNLLKLVKTRPDQQSPFCNRGCVTPIHEKHYHHSILVIWPKSQTLKIYCHHGLHSFLDRMEISLSPPCIVPQDAREKAAKDLGKIISICCDQPSKAWTKEVAKKGQLTLKLLLLCIVLRVREEGLLLLKFLGTDFAPYSAFLGSEPFEGIQNEQVAGAIVGFECHVAGWKDCAEPIKQMISLSRISKQFLPITKLAKYLLKVNCFEGTNMVADGISSSLVHMDKLSAERLKKADIEAYIDLIISLEADPKTSNPERMTTFIAFFPKLEASLQCHLVLDLEAQGPLRLKGIESCDLMYHGMCQAAPNCNLRSRSIKISLVADMLTCYVRLKNTEFLQLLTNNICRLAAAPCDIRASKNQLLENLISLSSVWNLATSSDLGKSTVALLVDTQLNLVKNQFSAMQKETNPAIISDWQHKQQPLFKSLSSCFRLVILLEKNSLVLEPRRFSTIASLLAKLNIHQLCFLLAEVLKSNSERLRKRPCSVVLIRQMCEMLLLRFNKAFVTHDVILQTVRCFIQLGDDSLTRPLIEKICVHGVTGSNGDCACSFFTELVTSSDIYGKLDCALKLLVLNSCTTVVELGISKICQLESTEIPLALSKLFMCVNLFILVEKNRICSEQKCVANSFQPLFSKLPAVSIMDLVIELYQSESKAHPNIKKFAVCFDFYRDLCRCFFNRDFVPLANSKADAAINLIHVLLWLGDDECWQSFVSKICAAFSSQESNCILRGFILDVSIQEALANSPIAFDAFTRIVDFWSEQSKTLKEPVFNWEQLKAELPGHPEVEAFLRSPLNAFSYSNFSSFMEACLFADELNNTGPAKGFSVMVKVSPWGGGAGESIQCDILKTKNPYFNDVQRDFITRKKELIDLVDLLQRLNREKAKRKRLAEAVTAPDEDVIDLHVVSCPKLPKLDIPIIEI